MGRQSRWMSAACWLRASWLWFAPTALLVLAGVVCWFIGTGQFLVLPGEAADTSNMVSISGQPAKPNAGKLLLVTVYSAPANVDEWLFGHVYPHASLVPAATQIPPNTTYERFRHIEEAMMTDSQTTAKVVAFRQLGYQVQEHGQGTVIDNVQPNSPAARAGLQKGDLIESIDGQSVDTNQQLAQAITAMAPGQQVSLALKPNNSDSERHVEATLGARPGRPGQAFLGVVSMTYRPSFEFPKTVSINAHGIIGPSGGLVLTMSIMQALSPTDITHGHTIAATGTIDLQGNVGAIGDVGDKVIASEGQAQYFFVPKDNLAEARAAAAGSKLQVVEIDSISQAVSALQSLAPVK